MRRSIITLIGAGGELIRFLGIMALARAFFGGAIGGSSMAFLQFAVAPQLLFACGFFFLWRNPNRYGIFRPLLAAGKALCALSLVSLVIRFVAHFQQDISITGNPGILFAALLAFLVWDIASGLALVVSLKRHPKSTDIGAEPDRNLAESTDSE